MTYSTVIHCGNDHPVWLQNLDFYKDDLNVLEKRLEEIAGKNNRQETMSQVEHYQNQFIIQKNNIDELKHRIHEHDSSVASDTKEHFGKMETKFVSEHEEIKEEFETLATIISDLRKHFNEFLSKYM